MQKYFWEQAEDVGGKGARLAGVGVTTVSVAALLVTSTSRGNMWAPSTPALLSVLVLQLAQTVSHSWLC